MDLRKVLLKAISIGCVVGCTAANAQSPTYYNVEDLTSSGTFAAAFESNIDTFMLPVDLLQFASSAYNIGISTTGSASSSPQIDFVSTHQSTYCLATLPSPFNITMEGSWCQNQNSTASVTSLGDVRAAVLLDPVIYPDSGSSGSSPLNIAALAYIKNITVPFPSPMFMNYISNPTTFNKNSTQQTAYANFMAGQAQVSMARYALDQIYSMRVTGQDVGGSSPPPGYATQSLMQVIETEATRRFTDPNYVSGFLTAGASETPGVTTQQDLIRDLVAMQAFQIYLDYQAYRQNERIAALLATMLANTGNGSISGVVQATSGVAGGG